MKQTQSKQRDFTWCIFALIALCCLLIFPTAHAQLGPIVITDDEDDDTDPGPVSNAVPFEIGDTAAGEFTGFREVIGKQSLQQAGSSLAEIVATESGVQFRESGGLGSASSISLRGSSAEQVNVYIDGILLNDASSGIVNFSDIELLQAEKVEIYKGTVPVQLGNSAIGGAVNIISARATDTPVSSFLTGLGSFGSSRFSAAYRGPLKLLDDQTFVASVSFRQSENDFPFLNDNGTNFNTDDDRRERRNNAQTRSLSGFFKTGHRLWGNAKLEHALQLSDRSQGIANFRNTEAGAAQLDSVNAQWRSTLRRTATTGGWSSLWEVNGSLNDESFDDRDGSIGLSSQLTETDTSVLGARGYWEKINNNNSLSFSLKFRGEDFRTVNELSQANATNARRLRSDFSVQGNRYYNQGATLLSASAVGFVVNDDYDIDNFEQARADFSTTAVVPQLGFSHTVNDRMVILGNASLQRRVPSFFELFGSQGLFVGNSSLETETSTNLDIGFKWNSDPSQPVDRQFSATFFHNNRDDLIVRTFNAQGVGTSQNLSRATVFGAEFAASAVWPKGFSVDLAMTIQDTENRSNLRGQSGRQLPGEAAVDGAITTGWRNNHWKLEYEFKINTDRFFDTGNFLVAADQRIHGVSVSRNWRNWRLDFELNNITDRNFEDFNGFPRPGRAGFISLFYQPRTSQ